MTTTTPEPLADLAAELVRAGASVPDAAEALTAAAGGDRRRIELARDRAAAQVGARVDDFEASAVLQLLNRVLSHVPVKDPLDWKPRWGQRFRRP